MDTRSQLELHFVTHRFFQFYGLLDRIMEEDRLRYEVFQRGDKCVIPYDDPYYIVAIVSDKNQTLDADILPAICGVKELFIDSSLDSHDPYTKSIIKVEFVGFNPSANVKATTILMLQAIVGRGFTYQLA